MKIIIRQLGFCDYEPIWSAMRNFTEQRNQQSNDEIWLLEHPSLFTQGLAGKSEHLLKLGSIPVIQTERGGQVTYHGPGQLICYVLIDLKRHKLGIKSLVNLLEQSIIDMLAKYQIYAQRRTKAPGVYVNNAKIAALGLRVRKGCTYHGLAINIEMDLEPFSRINPCGYAGLEVTQVSDLVTENLAEKKRDKIARELVILLCAHLNYNQQNILWKTSLPNN